MRQQWPALALVGLGAVLVLSAPRRSRPALDDQIARDGQAARSVFRHGALILSLGEERSAAVTLLAGKADRAGALDEATARADRRLAVLGVAETLREPLLALRRDVTEREVIAADAAQRYSAIIDRAWLEMLRHAGGAAHSGVVRLLFSYGHYVQAADQFRRAGDLGMLLGSGTESDGAALRDRLAASLRAGNAHWQALLARSGAVDRAVYRRQAAGRLDAGPLASPPAEVAGGERTRDGQLPFEAALRRADTALRELQPVIVAQILRRIDHIQGRRHSLPASGPASLSLVLLGLLGSVLLGLRRAMRVCAVSPAPRERAAAPPPNPGRLAFLSEARHRSRPQPSGRAAA